MNQNLIGLSQRYVAALEKNLKQGSEASLKPALALGRQAVALGLETSELARIHEQALATLKLPNIRNTLSRLAKIFFAEANIPIKETHRAARQSDVHLSRMKEKLGQCQKKMAAGKCPLQHGDGRYKVRDKSVKKNEERYGQCLEESLEQQRCLRQLTHRVLAAQEEERKKISCELQDEIAQMLLGINVRLLCLKQQNRSRNHGLRNEIASAKRLVAKSAKSVLRFAHELNNRHTAHDDIFVPMPRKM
jgi:signal transduction histidine kinase